ncbi:matrix extracellular phosphoglycoprotein isoform X1 [Tupaia chinensis]|uniref:matrix extracellular phosphoglycoprotein isoform X1 n=1 Tax=Tupaia chinensis TaxID=246437 RepID=UPI0003C8C634|nr:matrix extracellular phosphoglycoprotein isoform X1 [Tupaia chinensis]
MQVVCVGLFLFSVTWAAPTFQPQNDKTQQGCVEEQRITYKGHHEKHGYYMFKYVYTSPGKKNQTDAKQEEQNKSNIVSQPSNMKRNQEPSPKENTALERPKDTSLSEASEKNHSGKSQNLFASRQTLNEGYISKKENTHNDVQMPIYSNATGDQEAEGGDDAASRLHDQEEYGAALTRNQMQHRMGPVTVTKLVGKGSKENKPRNALSRMPAGANHARAHWKGKKNHRRDKQAENSPGDSKSPHHRQQNTDYLKQLPKVKHVPSDFEGSGYTDLQERGDNAFPPFSGDGQPFKDTAGKGGAMGPDQEGADIQTGFSGPSEAEAGDLDTRGPGYNEIPEREANGGDTVGARDENAEVAGAAGASLVEGSNDILGTTNFQELPGREGNRVDKGGQNAHQGKVEFHYPQPPSKEKRKEGSRDATESTNFNEIPKNGNGGTRKGADHSHRSPATFNDKQRISSKGGSRGSLIPSDGLDNDIGSPHHPNNEGKMITPHRNNHYVPHGQNNSIRNKGMSQRRGSWGYRRAHSNRSVRPWKKDDSSDSDSSSESDGD